MRRILLGLAALIPFGLALAQDRYPSKPVQVITVFAVGGGTDVIARAYAAEMSKLLGQPFVVTPRLGAAGSVGFGALAASAPDGYTISFAPNTPLVNSPHIIKGLPYTFDSIAPICGVFDNVFSLAVAPASPYKTLKDLIDDARSKPGTIAYGTSGLGSVPHLSMAALTRAAGVSMNAIAFKGDNDQLPQLLSGELPVATVAVSSIFGRDLRVLAVFGSKRQHAYPNTPVVTELGYPKIPQGFNGVFAPKAISKPVRDTLERSCEQIVRMPSFVGVVEKLNQTIEYVPSAEFAKQLKEDYDFKGRLIQETKLQFN